MKRIYSSSEYMTQHIMSYVWLPLMLVVMVVVKILVISIVVIKLLAEDTGEQECYDYQADHTHFDSRSFCKHVLYTVPQKLCLQNAPTLASCKLVGLP